MAKNIERVSVNKFEMALTADNVITETLIDTDDVTIQINKTISLPEMMLFVQEVVEACIDGESGEYIPEAYDFAIRTAVLTHYANFAMPSNLEKQYWLVYNTRGFQQVVNLINECQFNDIIRAIDKKIKFMLDVMSSAAVSKINEVINKFNDIAETGEKVFGGSSVDEMANFVSGISKLKDMKEEDIAKIVLETKAGDNNG